jgi:hypothetical protein
MPFFTKFVTALLGKCIVVLSVLHPVQECLPPALDLPKELEQLRRTQAAIRTALNSSNSNSSCPAEQQGATTDSLLLQFQVCAALRSDL